MTFPVIKRWGVNYTDAPSIQTSTKVLPSAPSDAITLLPTKNYLVIDVTADEYTDLLSSAYNGAARFYPDNYIDVISPLLRAVTMTLCDAVADCIANSAAVQSALDGFLGDRNVPIAKATNPSNISDGNLLSGVSCTDDAIFGAILAIEDFIHDVSLDFIEQVVDQIEDTLSLLRAIDFFPVVGDLPVLDDLNDLVLFVKSRGTSSFNAGYDAGIRLGNACYVYEIACSTCEATIQDFISAYAARGGISFDPTDQFQLIINLLLGTQGDISFAAGIMAMVAAAIGSNNAVAGITGLPTIENIAANSSPSNLWDGNCDPCNYPTAPVILFSNGCGGYNEGGTITDLGNGIFRIISSPGLPNGDNQICIRAADGQPFRINHQAWVGGQSTTGFYDRDGSGCQGGFLPNLIPANQASWIGFNPGDGIEFTFLQP